MADDSSDKSSGTQEPVLGSSQDMLFGWLVRRASADLGLAEAIAAGEARRTEQLRRLEETLLAKVQELQPQPRAAAPAGEVEELKGELEGVAARVGLLESTLQQARQVNESLNAEIAKIGDRLGEQQSRIETRYAGVETTAETIVAKIRELQQRMSAQPPMTENITSAIGELQNRVQSLTEHMARFEPADPSRGAAEREAERARWMVESDERTAFRIRELGDEIREKLRALPPRQADLQTGRSESAALGERIGAVESGMRQLSSELKTELNAQRLALSAEQGRRHAGENFVEELEQRLGARLSNLETAVQEKLPGVEAQRAEKTAQDLMADFAALKAGLGDYGQALKTAQSLMESLETTIGRQFQELRDQLAQTRHGAEVRDEQLRETARKMDVMAERLAEAEAIAHRTHTLMVNESEQDAERRERLKIELDELRAQLTHGPATDAIVRAIEEKLNLKMGEWESRLAQRFRLLEYRDAELRELKTQVQNLGDGLSRTGELNISAAPAHGRGIPVAGDALRTGREGRFVMSNSFEEGADGGAPADLSGGVSPGGGVAGGNREQLYQLQERISADIERARAQLREKSGRWKAPR